MRIISTTVLGFLIWIGLIGCGSQSAEKSDLSIWVSIPPQKTFVEAVAGDHAEVSVMIPPGQSPGTYSPSVPQMAALAQSDIYFGIGVPMERRILNRIERSMPQLRFVQTAEIVEHEHEHEHVHEPSTHDHGEAGVGSGPDEDPHLWMDPIRVVDLVEQVEAALSEERPDLAEDFAANAATLKQKLRALDSVLSEQLAPYEGRAFYINHPSLGHFARRYNLIQRSIEVGGSTPSSRQVAELVRSAKADNVGAVFSQPEFEKSSVDALARALDVKVITLDVLSADYFDNMRAIAKRLEESFTQ
jgi:zinc transport system substrate-binding protein